VIVLLDNIRYQLITPENEATLEKAIQANHRHIFGEDSFYFDVKKKIRSKAGIASIPDAYVLLFDPKPKWCIVEVELASHPIYDHIIPQLTKFNRGIENTSTRKKLVETLYTFFDEDEVLKARLKQKIGSGEVYKFISDLISEKPLIIVAIDQKTEELEEALRDVRGDKKIVEFRTFRREGIANDVNAYVYEPVFKTSKPPKVGVDHRKVTQYSLPKRRQTITHSMFELFDQKGVDDVTYDECESLAKRVKPDTKFDKSHFSWYKNKYKQTPSCGLPT